MTQAECANGAAVFTGSYRAVCHQHAHEGARSVGAQYQDAWYVVSDVDRRLRQSLSALSRKAGFALMSAG
jgi:hypothetical protein